MMIFLFASIFILVTLFYHRQNTGLRESVVKSFVVLFLVIAVSTEMMSFFDAITRYVMCWFWVTIPSILLIGILFMIRRLDMKFLINNLWNGLTNHEFHERLFISLIGIILATTLFIALISPPNNWDSMTYHMARVAEWIQHQNVDFYPTSIHRQNHSMPLAEFAVLHLQLLSGSDRFANMVQWFSMMIAILLASLIAKEFQISRRMQVFAGLMVATTPMVILQSSSTQNDVVMGAFCMGFAYFLLRLVRTQSLEDVFFCALSFGLALLTKGTSYIYCFAIGLVIGLPPLLSTKKQSRKWPLLLKLSIVIIFGLMLNTGHFTRNMRLYGHPLSKATSYITNDKFSIAITSSNLVRNVGLHLGTPFSQFNEYTLGAIKALLGDELNNPMSTFGTKNFSIPFSLYEDTAGNLFHILLAGMAFLVLPLVANANKKLLYIFAGVIICSAVLYSAIIKWQPWASRLHTPFFMLSAPFAAMVLYSMSSLAKRLSLYLAILLFIGSTPFLLSNVTRPLIPLSGNHSIINTSRLKLYFTNWPYLYRDYSTAVRMVLDEHEAEIGLYMGDDDLEYPLWVLAGRHAGKGTPRFRHVGVKNISNTLEIKNRPTPVFVLATTKVDGNIIDGKEYITVFDSPHIRVLKFLKDA